MCFESSSLSSRDFNINRRTERASDSPNKLSNSSMLGFRWISMRPHRLCIEMKGN